MATKEQADEIINEIHGRDLDRQKLTVQRVRNHKRRSINILSPEESQEDHGPLARILERRVEIEEVMAEEITIDDTHLRATIDTETARDLRLATMIDTEIALSTDRRGEIATPGLALQDNYSTQLSSSVALKRTSVTNNNKMLAHGIQCSKSKVLRKQPNPRGFTWFRLSRRKCWSGPSKRVLMFPGQGTQYVGMGKVRC